MPASAAIALAGASAFLGLIVAILLAGFLNTIFRDWRKKRDVNNRKRKIAKARKEMLRRERKANAAYIERVKEFYNGIE